MLGGETGGGGNARESERPDRVPLWVRLWYYTPLIDRYAYPWMRRAQS